MATAHFRPKGSTRAHGVRGCNYLRYVQRTAKHRYTGVMAPTIADAAALPVEQERRWPRYKIDVPVRAVIHKPDRTLIRVRSEVRNRNGYRYGVELVPEGMEERSEVTRLRQMLTTFEAKLS